VVLANLLAKIKSPFGSTLICNLKTNLSYHSDGIHPGLILARNLICNELRIRFLRKSRSQALRSRPIKFLPCSASFWGWGFCEVMPAWM
jgi:hypothetical protein